MPASKYDIYAEQGSTLKIHLQLKTRAGVPIDLSGFTGQMQVRRSVSDEQLLLQITDNTVVGGGTTGEFTLGSGVSGSGGIIWGIGVTGASGATGCLLIKVDANTMTRIPEGKHFYDLKVTNTLGEVQRLLEGMFEVPAQVSRTT